MFAAPTGLLAGAEQVGDPIAWGRWPDPGLPDPGGTTWQPLAVDYTTRPGGASGWAGPLPGPVPAGPPRVPPAYRVWAHGVGTTIGTAGTDDEGGAGGYAA